MPIISPVLCYSVRLLRPLLASVKDDPRLPVALTTAFDAVDPDARIPALTAHAALEHICTLVNDPLLAVRASLLIEPGDMGVLDYALGTASDLRSAIETQLRYSRLVSDVANPTWTIDEERAEYRFATHIPMSDVAAEYGICSFLAACRTVWPAQSVEQLHVFFARPKPADTSLYAQAFATAKLHFGAAHWGFTLPAKLLHLPMGRAEPKLHDVLKREMARALAELPKVSTFCERVRELLTIELRSGNPNVERIARLLHTSASTLARRLAAEGTSFSELLDDLRRQLALQYVASTNLDSTEIALLTGFSQAPAFHRAFRRWVGVTPSQYRRAQQRLL